MVGSPLAVTHAAAAPRLVAGAATATSPGPAAAACAMRHDPGFAVAAVARKSRNAA
jgi:hypothetical protein